MAVAKNPDLLRSTRYVLRRDPATNVLEHHQAIQRAVVTGLTDAGDVTVLKQACEELDTLAEWGSPSIDSGLELKEVLADPLSSTKAAVTGVYGRDNFFAVKKRQQMTTWSVPFIFPARRFLDSSSNIIEDSTTQIARNNAGQLAQVTIPTPAMRIYSRVVVTSAPSADEASIGDFGLITGFTAKVMFLGKNVKKYETDTVDEWDSISIYEFRAVAPTDAWEIHIAGPNDKVLRKDLNP